MNPTSNTFITLKNIMNQIRKQRFKRKAKSLFNNDVTILCNTCLAGIIYNTLSLKFLSPTINLELSPQSFLDYVKNISDYKNGTFIDRNKKLGTYFGPHAYLKVEGKPDLDIIFTHYREFEEATLKWKEREKRINQRKIFILYEARFDDQISLIDEINALPYPKIILSSLPNDPKRNIIHMDYYLKEPNKPITSFKGIFGKRALDDFDFVNIIFNRNY